ncbi:hypothetical protein chiPu_0029394, partial [Chiloscyllium punctatum]|nr:hypothetical protein [Chiloscyllium punctatum]
SQLLTSVSLSLFQRAVTRRRYEDDGISDDEIEGKRTFDLEEKLESSMYSASFVRFMEGKGDHTEDCVQSPSIEPTLALSGSSSVYHLTWL